MGTSYRFCWILLKKNLCIYDIFNGTTPQRQRLLSGLVTKVACMEVVRKWGFCNFHCITFASKFFHFWLAQFYKILLYSVAVLQSNSFKSKNTTVSVSFPSCHIGIDYPWDVIKRVEYMTHLLISPVWTLQKNVSQRLWINGLSHLNIHLVSCSEAKSGLEIASVDPVRVGWENAFLEAKSRAPPASRTDHCSCWTLFESNRIVDESAEKEPPSGRGESGRSRKKTIKRMKGRWRHLSDKLFFKAWHTMRCSDREAVNAGCSRGDILLFFVFLKSSVYLGMCGHVHLSKCIRQALVSLFFPTVPLVFHVPQAISDIEVFHISVANNCLHGI